MINRNLGSSSAKLIDSMLKKKGRKPSRKSFRSSYGSCQLGSDSSLLISDWSTGARHPQFWLEFTSHWATNQTSCYKGQKISKSHQTAHKTEEPTLGY